jgi:hypothetical protein
MLLFRGHYEPVAWLHSCNKVAQRLQKWGNPQEVENASLAKLGYRQAGRIQIWFRPLVISTPSGVACFAVACSRENTGFAALPKRFGPAAV